MFSAVAYMRKGKYPPLTDADKLILRPAAEDTSSLAVTCAIQTICVYAHEMFTCGIIGIIPTFDVFNAV